MRWKRVSPSTSRYLRPGLVRTVSMTRLKSPTRVGSGKRVGPQRRPVRQRMDRHQPLVVVAHAGPDRAPGVRVPHAGRRAVLRIPVVAGVAEVARIASEELRQLRPVRELRSRQELLEDRQPIRSRPLQCPKYSLPTVHGSPYPPCMPPALRDRPPVGTTQPGAHWYHASSVPSTRPTRLARLENCPPFHLSQLSQFGLTNRSLPG